MTALLTGMILAAMTGLLGTFSGMDRDRSFYAVITIVIGSYYVLFATAGADAKALIPELLFGTVFMGLVLLGFKSTQWVIVAAMALHGVFDLAHDLVITNTGVPVWWPDFCGAYDITIAAFLAWRLYIDNNRLKQPGAEGT